MAIKVAIFGAGVAGLTAAFELRRRGFDVDLYEREKVCGGKSRTFEVPVPPAPPTAAGHTATPGEHGFRFFPGFYRHLIDIMRDIPNLPLAHQVVDDLVGTPEAGLAFKGEGLVRFPRNLSNYSGPAEVFTTIANLYSSLNFTDEDLKRMAWFRLKYLTSGDKRRTNVYEKMSWYDFVDGGSTRYSARFQAFDKSIPRTMSALVSEKTSAKVIGDISMQFLLGLGRPSAPDHVLRGPSTEIWLEHWVAHLVNNGVKVYTEHTLTSINVDNANQVKTCTVLDTTTATKTDITANRYVVAVPINDFRTLVDPLVNPTLFNADPMLATVAAIPPDKVDGWMVGAQVYLQTDFPMVAGHMFYPDSEWALTSISQGQFWSQQGGPINTRYGDGLFSGILSIIISDWDTPSKTYPFLTARQTLAGGGPQAVVAEAINQIRQAVGPSTPALQDLNTQPAHYFLDPGVVSPTINRTPLLLHPVDGYKDRPQHFSNVVKNLYLASDYVQTSVQLACMEGACEAARKAVNKILDDESSPHVRCPSYDLFEEQIFQPAKDLDDRRYLNGRDHIMDAFPFRLLLDAPALSPIVQILMTTPLEILDYL